MIGLCAGAGHAQPPAASTVYRNVVAAYLKTHNAVTVVTPMLGWDRKMLDAAVNDVMASGDEALIEAAALLHLEVGVAIAGFSAVTAQGYFDLGETLLDNIVPEQSDRRRRLTAERRDELARIRATWLGVAGSTFLSVNDTEHARRYFNRALRLTPKSAAILTLRGAADEIDGAVLNPDDVENTVVRSRMVREKVRLLQVAELYYSRALDADPSYALAQIRMGRAYVILKRYRIAQDWLAKGAANARAPSEKFLAAMFTGALQDAQQNHEGARASFEQAAALAPRSQNAVVALAYQELMSGRPDRAQAVARRFIDASGDEAWWAVKNGTFDHLGLQWLRSRVLK